MIKTEQITLFNLCYLCKASSFFIAVGITVVIFERVQPTIWLGDVSCLEDMNDATMCTRENKKARPVELALPFLAAGDLSKFASSKLACSHMATESFEKRLAVAPM